MDILNLAANTIALSTSYEGDVDIKLFSIRNNSEENINFYKEDFLKNAADRKINNYSSLYLVNKQKFSDFANLQTLSELSGTTIFNTSIIDNNSGLYLTVSSVSGEEIPFYFTTKTQKFIDHSDRIFEIELLDYTRAKIYHRSKFRQNYYLSYNDRFKFNLTDNEDSIFNYILDKKNNRFCLFKEINLSLMMVKLSGSKLIMDDYPETFESNYFNVNYYVQHLIPKLNSSWVSYNPNNKNYYEVNPLKSRNDLENNYLVSTQYSYVTGNTLSANILTLKNQKTHKNYSYRSDYLELRNDGVPVVDNRKYFGLFSGNDQEKGDYNINLSYEFYNVDYRFKADEYTIFYTPESIYPYTQININDLKWDSRGAIGGDNPYQSDKIFQKKSQSGSINGEYLCSWLHKNRKGELVWLDRYYYPEKTTYASALSTSFNYTFIDPINNLLHKSLEYTEYYDVPDIYNTLQEEYDHTPQELQYALYGRSFFDKRSDLVILPNTEYIYHRIGDKYVSAVVDAISSLLIQDNLDFKNNNDATIYVTNDEYVLDGNSYADITNYADANNSHEFTIAFWMNSDDWTKKFGHQIIGNLNDKGFGLLNDEKITPLITVQNNNEVYVFNTEFSLLDIASLKNESTSASIIKDLYRTDHLDSFYTINID